jgi:S-adenosylmethionine decarboxylase
MKHILFTLKGCPFELLDDESLIREVISDASKISNNTLISLSSHKFTPHGVTAIALLAESHISIHTWPENNAAVCDVFTCGENTSSRAGVTYIYEKLEATDILSDVIDRNFIG